MDRIDDFKRAVLIGNSIFPKSANRLPALQGPLADVESLRQVLSDESRCWFKPIEVLRDAPHNEVLLRINETLRDAAQEDLVLVYYSGHGLLGNDGQLHLATVDTDPDLLPATSLAISLIRNCLIHSRCQRFVLILDCCYAGAASTNFAQGSVDKQLIGFTKDVPSGVGEFVMTASTAIESAERKTSDSVSVFTKHMVEGMRTGDADVDRDGYMRLSEIFEYVKRRVSQESAQEPQFWASGSAGSFIIGRTEQAEQRKLQLAVHRKLSEPGVRQSLPEAIWSGLKQVAEVPTTDAFRQRHNATAALAYGWARGDVSTRGLIDQWLRLRTDLIGVEEGPDVQLEVRWRTVESARRAILDLVAPTYLLDAHFHFLDWNPAFDEIVAKPLRLVRGSHARDLIVQLENCKDVVARAQRTFTADRIPLVDIEPLKLRTEKYGLVTFRKIAAQIAEDTESGRRLTWCVMLNIDAVDKPDALWKDVYQRLKEETNWSRYSVSYDQMLLEFPAYHQLLRDVTSLVGNARYCADLGAGTGNSAKALLNSVADRRVWAFEANEAMLQHLRTKLRDPDVAARLTIFKGDLILSLREFPEAFFDAVVMVNVFYALDEPERCLEEIYRVLKPGGILALSTSHSETDLDKLFAAIRGSLAAKGVLGRLQSAVDDAEDRNKEMLERILRFTRQQVVDLLTVAGFEILKRTDSSYADAVMILQAGKPSSIKPPKRQAERDQIFISYSHRDKHWLEQINTFITPSVKAKVKAWDDTGIETGDDWEAAINAAIARARVAVLLVTKDFLASTFITDKELPAIFQARANDGLKLVWIPVSACVYEEHGFHKIQAAHDPEQPLDTLSEPHKMWRLQRSCAVF